MASSIGIDLGSRTTKILQISGDKITHSEIFDTGFEPLPRVKESLSKLDADFITATGYGRHLLHEDLGARRVTEIKACARGVRRLHPACRTILDVGGQDCKVVALDESGRMIDFEMNDRCAAGTGRFIEVMARTLDLTLGEFIQMALSASEPVRISSMCTVFAESEVVSLITSGKPRDAITLGLHISVAERLSAMLSRLPVVYDILFVGGGAKNDCLHNQLEKKLSRTLYIPENPQILTALGAALIGLEEA